jgi:hypothetical protein
MAMGVKTASRTTTAAKIDIDNGIFCIGMTQMMTTTGTRKAIKSRSSPKSIP